MKMNISESAEYLNSVGGQVSDSNVHVDRTDLPRSTVSVYTYFYYMGL